MTNIFKVPEILKNIQFLKLWGNQVLLQVAFNMCNYAALLIIANRTHSVFTQAQFYASLTLPAFIFSLIAGPIVDMVDRKRIMLISNCSLAVLFLIYIFANGNMVVIMLVAFLTSSAARFFIPAVAATIPLVVDRKLLDQANAIFLFTLMGSVLLGYSIAGPLIQAFGGLGSKGEIVPFFSGSILLIISLILIYLLKPIHASLPHLPKGTIFKRMFHLLWQTIKEIHDNVNISFPILLLVFVELNVGILSVTLLEYVRRYLHLPLTSVSIILIVPLISGLIVGVLLLAEIEKRWGYRLSLYIACIGVGLLFFILGALPLVGAGSLGVFIIRVVTIIAAFIFGVLITIITVQARTTLQLHSKIEMHGRVFSFLDILIALVTPIPVLTLGFLADKISMLVMLACMGTGIIVVTYFGNKIVFRK